MRITPEEIDKLTEKLSSGQDTTEKEASGIKKVFSENTLKTVLNPHSRHFSLPLSRSLEKWFVAVKKSIEAGKKGNFLNTVFIRPYSYKIRDVSLKDMLKICLVDTALNNIDKAEKIYLSKEYTEEIFKKGTIKLEKNMIKAPSTQQYPLHSYIFNFFFAAKQEELGYILFSKVIHQYHLKKMMRFLRSITTKFFQMMMITITQTKKG